MAAATPVRAMAPPVPPTYCRHPSRSSTEREKEKKAELVHSLVVAQKLSVFLLQVVAISLWLGYWMPPRKLVVLSFFYGGKIPYFVLGWFFGNFFNFKIFNGNAKKICLFV